MPSWVVPSDSHGVGDTGHTTDHNHVADDLTLIAAILTLLAGGNTILVKVGSGYANGTFTAPGDGAQYSNFNLADGVYPLDQNPGGHYWALSHRATPAHDLYIFNYNGAGGYTNVLVMTEAGAVSTVQNVLDDGSGNTTVAGNLDVGTAGKGLRVKEGSNAKQGTAVLVAGSKAVSNTSVTASSRIFLTSQADGGTPGWLRVSARTAGTSFTISSSSATDTSTVAYQIFEPG